jgi:hypothetical protein
MAGLLFPFGNSCRRVCQRLWARRARRLIRGVFAPERFLDLIVDYVAFEI